MRNLNEPHRTEKTEAEPISFESRKPQQERPQLPSPSRPAEEFQSRWDAIQTGFVDDPRVAVNEADALIESAMKEISEEFSDKREHLKKQCTEQASTEDLRLAVQAYRSVFSSLTSMLAEWRAFEGRP